MFIFLFFYDHLLTSVDGVFVYFCCHAIWIPSLSEAFAGCFCASMYYQCLMNSLYTMIPTTNISISTPSKASLMFIVGYPSPFPSCCTPLPSLPTYRHQRQTLLPTGSLAQ